MLTRCYEPREKLPSRSGGTEGRVGSQPVSQPVSLRCNNGKARNNKTMDTGNKILETTGNWRLVMKVYMNIHV
jgi:hypothetical protein